MTWEIREGDCVEAMRAMPDGSVDAVVCDPPYALSFMGKPWDAYDGREDAGFAYWLAGFIDGEGCFSIKGHSRGTYAPSFGIKLRDDDRGILEGIRRTLGIGTITTMPGSGGSETQARWTVGDKAGCQRLVDLLDKYPLRAKKRNDYLIWREAVCEWTSRPRGNRWDGPADQTRITVLRNALMEGRRYTEVPWSGHEFQDWCRMWGTEALRVLRPGGHCIAFGGTRTYHRLTSGLEDAGFEVRDCLAWLYGSGFPKSLDVSKAIDKRATENEETARRIAAVAAVIREYRERAGMERAAVSLAVVGTPSGACWNWEHQQLPSVEMWPKIKETLSIPDDFDGLIEGDRARFIAAERAVIGLRTTGIGTGNGSTPIIGDGSRDLTAPATPDAERWQGWGTALKPAHEPIVVARKPLAGTVAGNVLAHGTGAINVDGCRIGQSGATRKVADEQREPSVSAYGDGLNGGGGERDLPYGRWPANVLMDEQAAAMLDAQTGNVPGAVSNGKRAGTGYHGDYGAMGQVPSYGDSGGASRFLYVAKASTAERNAGLDGFEARQAGIGDERPAGSSWERRAPEKNPNAPRANTHPTVKPIEVMRWLVRLITPPGGTVLDPFTGSGTTGIAAVLEGFNFVGLERETEYVAIARARIAWWERHPEGLELVKALQAERERKAVADTGQGTIFDLMDQPGGQHD